jgi:hypothetical protein
MTLAPALFAVGSWTDVIVLSTGHRSDEDALALNAPMSLVVGACFGIGVPFEAGGQILVEMPSAGLEGCRLNSVCLFLVYMAYSKAVNIKQTQ